ncbi:MAG: S9 family peptidase, partial [Acidimicrobiales bacterium]
LAYGLRVGEDPRVSPDGTRVLYTLKRVDPDTLRNRREVWLCAIDGSSPLPFATVPGSGGCWSPSGSQVAFIGGAGADGRSAIYVQDVEAGAEARQVTAHAQTIEDLAWSPDGDRIAYTTDFDPQNPDERALPPGSAPPVRVTGRIDYKQDDRGWLGDVRSHVFVVDVASGHRHRVSGPALDHLYPSWSPDGRWLAVRVPAGARLSTPLVLLDPDSGASRTVSPDDGIVDVWAWSPDGGRLLYSCDIGLSLSADYYLVELATGDTRRLTVDHQASPAGGARPSFPVWLDDQHALLHSTLAGGSVLEVLDTATGDVDLVYRGQCRNSGLSVDSRGRYVVQAHQSPTSYGEVSVFDRDRGVLARITTHNDATLAAHPPAGSEQLEVKSGEHTIDCWLLTPPDFDAAQRYPVVLDIHGGPNSDYGYGFLAHQQCLATDGFLVVFANPRGSTSYGRAFAQAALRDWGGGDCDDVIAALDAVLARPYADPTRTGVFGISYGGYLVSWLIGHTDRFAAAVCGEPIFDLVSDYGTSEVAHNGLERYAGGPPHEQRQWYLERSPSTYAHRARTPTMVFAGEDDHICPIGQSEELFTALKKAGCEAQLVRYPGGSHMFFANGLPEHRADLLSRTLSWFHEHLRSGDA